jgi:DNA-binding transcriptional LysR family regulator
VRGWTNPPSAYKELARRLPRNISIVHHLVSTESLLRLVAAGYGLAVVPGSTTDVAPPGVVFRPIREPDAKVPVFAAWLDETDNPVKVKFVAELRAFAERSAAKSVDCVAKLLKRSSKGDARAKHRKPTIAADQSI